ncbi:MAG: asparagine--tRNA ligase [Candidatus Thermoplasmatota archaeon]|jgi:asparaginyl-tRNA synthetase|nr:asparagine--tRNA ligase [Candidatus Thermoplasmatota archaeon]
MHSIKEILSDEFIGKQVTVHGWVYRTRSSGKIAFVVLRDSSGIVQSVANISTLGDEKFKVISSLGIESSVELQGTVKKDDRAITGYEIEVTGYKVYQRNESFPITKDKGEEFLLDNRHLWLRSQEFSAVLKVRSTVFKAFADFFYSEGYYQVQAPFMVSTATEGGTTLFKVPFFGSEVSLTQSAQFYLETMIFSLEKVFTISPSFRAEKSRTWRHLTEYWHGEAEVAWVDNSGMMDIEERMIHFIIRRVLEENLPELAILGRDAGDLRRWTEPFLRMTYSDLIKGAQETGMNIRYGDDLGSDEEKQIMIHYDRPVFVTHYPKELKTFYHRPDPENPGELLCHDLLAPEGYGEIIGGSERIWDPEQLKERMEEYKLNPEDYYWYMDLRKYGSVPHSGFGLGLDRAIMWICKLDNIKNAIPFPRTIRRTKP